MRLYDALSQIADIRQQIARSHAFAGFRSFTTGLTGALAVVAAMVQKKTVVDPIHHMNHYLTIWLVAALVSIVVVGIELALRCWRADRPLQREMSFHAIEQMMPSIVAGALLTFVIVQFAGEIAWILPGMWSILFGLGVFASRRLLPRATFLVGGFYLLAGLYMVSMRYDALSAWTMGATFGIGQISAAALLYFSLEREIVSVSSNKKDLAKEPAKESAPESAKDSPKDSPKDSAAPFAYEGLERVIHERARLSILSSLAAHSQGLVFNDLKSLCALTDGNLSRQIQLLQEAGFVEVWKGTKNNRPQTLCRLTDPGRRRFLDYIAELEQVVSNAAAMQKQDGKPAKGRLSLA